ncbi:hypothetical protein EVA_02762 [gut metagenome]|uniref:Uncharacterized protein n=1 Tax=gut metagenome TaxID=749906 RepID=J9D8K5_9ZZZZ
MVQLPFESRQQLPAEPHRHRSSKNVQDNVRRDPNKPDGLHGKNADFPAQTDPHRRPALVVLPELFLERDQKESSDPVQNLLRPTFPGSRLLLGQTLYRLPDRHTSHLQNDPRAPKLRVQEPDGFWSRHVPHVLQKKRSVSVFTVISA